jgi:oxalate---CoA ligase
MAMGTPSESYDSEQGSWLLKSKGEDVINTATRNLLSRGILSKSQRDSKKQGPGRQLKISEMYVLLTEKEAISR